MSLYTLFFAVQFVVYFFIFMRMSYTNQEEWKYTKIVNGALIGAIFGGFSGAVLGYTTFLLTNILLKYSNGLTGLFYGSSSGMIIGSIAFILNIFLFNYRTKPKIINSPNTVTSRAIDKNKEIFKQLKDLEKQLKNNNK